MYKHVLDDGKTVVVQRLCLAVLVLAAEAVVSSEKRLPVLDRARYCCCFTVSLRG